jgi:16S rRNA (cytosine1402-N4)-methyltransferase
MVKVPHIPVLLHEAIASLNIKDGGVYIDATFGAGGYTRAILDTNSTAKVIAFDRDLSVIKFANDIAKKYEHRFTFVNDKFSNIANHLDAQIDGAVFDIGVSSMQIDNAERGFSYRFDAPLDMRMDTSSGLTAADILNTFSENELSDIFYNYGEEKNSFRIAKIITEERKLKPVNTTFDLINIISKTVPENKKIDCVKRIFQSLRIAVNDELNELQIALQRTSKIIKSGGVLSVITFHSLEDRIVKNFFNPQQVSNRYSIETFSQNDVAKSLFQKVQKKVIIPTETELKNNSRSASAKLRYAEKI